MNTNVITMGVINITPNSFSDGGSTFSLDTFLAKWDLLLEQKVSIIDIGAESTAPFNNPVSESDEARRFEQMLFPLLGTLRLPEILSIDTYRPSVFKFVYDEVKRFFPQQKFIFNDVSGILDEELWELLTKCQDVDYVLGHTLITDRFDTSKHMESLVEGDLLKVLEKYFSEGYAQFAQRRMGSRVIFDPLFGFSKTLEQNWRLLQDLPSLVKRFPQKQRWLLGISKKSFLQKKLPQNLGQADILRYTEYFHAHILSRWMHQIGDHQLIFRVHDPMVVTISLLIENTL